MLVFTAQQYDQILSHAQAGLPNEACGLIAGIRQGENNIVRKVYLLQNTDQSPEHFSMDPKEQFDAVSDMRRNEYTLLGNFHSHPATPARPSEEDIRLAFDSSISYIIVSLQQHPPVLKCFRIRQGTVRDEPYKVLENGSIQAI